MLGGAFWILLETLHHHWGPTISVLLTWAISLSVGCLWFSLHLWLPVVAHIYHTSTGESPCPFWQSSTLFRPIENIIELWNVRSRISWFCHQQTPWALNFLDIPDPASLKFHGGTLTMLSKWFSWSPPHRLEVRTGQLPPSLSGARGEACSTLITVF